MRRHSLTGFSLLSLFLLLCLSTMPASADVLDRILQQKTLKVGVALFAPWTMKDTQGELIGFEIDMVRFLASDLGVKPELKVYRWEDIVPALQKGEIDLIAAGMAITPQRALQVEFSQPYMTSGVALATHLEKTRDIKSLSELNQEGRGIAVVKDTLAMEVSFKLFDKARLMIFPKIEDARAAILNGEAIAYVGSLPEVTYLALLNPGKIDMPLQKPLQESRAGFAVKKGEQALLNFLNAWVVSRESDGTLNSAHAYWFRTIDWKSRVLP